MTCHIFRNTQIGTFHLTGWNTQVFTQPCPAHPSKGRHVLFFCMGVLGFFGFLFFFLGLAHREQLQVSFNDQPNRVQGQGSKLQVEISSTQEARLPRTRKPSRAVPSGSCWRWKASKQKRNTKYGIHEPKRGNFTKRELRGEARKGEKGQVLPFMVLCQHFAAVQDTHDRCMCACFPACFFVCVCVCVSSLLAYRFSFKKRRRVPTC